MRRVSSKFFQQQNEYRLNKSMYCILFSQGPLQKKQQQEEIKQDLPAL